MNHIYRYKISIHEIHVFMFLQLDWMLKGTLQFFQSINVLMFVTPAQLCVPMPD